VLSGGIVKVASGGLAVATTIDSGGTLIDNGTVVFSGSTAVTFGGTLSGSGSLVEEGTGSLVLSGVTSGFAGTLVLSGGTAELANAAGVGGGAVVWASTGTATLKIDAADSPAAGSTFSSTLSNFDQIFDGLDLKGVAYVAGATAVLSGATLALTEGGKVHDFHLAGLGAATYSAATDGAGGTLIKADTAAKVTLPAVGPFVQAMAGFGAEAAPAAALANSATAGVAPLLMPAGGVSSAGGGMHGG
jgi:autotransporter passenger strand-loop-strand repeat protein